MKYDTAIIGAGPAGLFCAYELSKNTDLKILLIDAGPRFEQKHCNYLSTGICTHCKVCCNLSGFGGAAFFNPGKLSLFPAGSGLLDVTGSEEKCKRYYLRAINILNKYGIDIKEEYRTAHIPGLNSNDDCISIKYYNSCPISKKVMHTFANNMQEYLSNHISILSNTTIFSINRDHDDYWNLYSQNNETIETRNLVIAVGEFGYNWWHTISNSLGVSQSFSYIDIGFRLEFPSSDIKPVGPYSSRVLEKKRQYCIEQLSINRAYLEEIDVRYDTIEWDNATQNKLYLYSKKTDSRKYIEPFAIFDKSSYTHLYGREREEDDLIKTILNSKVKNKAAVLVGPSKIGKSSLVHGRIEQAFTEMDFSVRIYDYISDDKFFSENNISEGNSEKTPSNKRLIIFDQAERLLTGNNSDSITKRLKSLHHDTISDSGLYILFVIRNDYYSEFKAFLSSIDLTEELCFLSHALGIDILKKLLIENSIVYSDDVLRNIDNYLSLIDKNDLTTLQIVISSLIKKNRALLDSEEIIYKTFGSIDKMVDAVMHGFFNNIFEGLNKSERYLLMSACNNRQNGTIRAFTPAHTEEKESLKSRNIITVLDDDSYEFIHDALAEYFCKEVLNGCEKELLKLKSIISEGNVSPDALQKIQKYRTHLIQLYHFSEKAIGQLIYYYATENNTDQIDYWFSHYLSCDTLMAVIDSFTNGFFDRLTSTSFPYYRELYVDCVRKCYESLPDIEKNRFTLSLNNKWSTSKKYMEFCAVDILNSIIPYEVRDSVISIHEGATIYNALLIEPQFKDIFCEIYYFLYFHDLLDNFVEKNTINAVWLRRVAIMLQYGIECGFYRIICENENVFAVLSEQATNHTLVALREAFCSCFRFW